MANHFYAYISRMRCVKRWALMRNTEEENIQEHSHMVAVLAHALALIARVSSVCPRTRTPWRSPRSTTTQRRS